MASHTIEGTCAQADENGASDTAQNNTPASMDNLIRCASVLGDGTSTEGSVYTAAEANHAARQSRDPRLRLMARRAAARERLNIDTAMTPNAPLLATDTAPSDTQGIFAFFSLKHSS